MSKRTLAGLVVAASLAGGGADASNEVVAHSPSVGPATSPAATCTAAQKARRQRALRAYRAKMASARRAYFRKHRSAKMRRAFVKRQNAKLKALKRAAACTVSSSPQPPPSEGAGVDLRVRSITDSPDPVPVGGTVTYQVVVENGSEPDVSPRATETRVTVQAPSIQFTAVVERQDLRLNTLPLLTGCDPVPASNTLSCSLRDTSQGSGVFLDFVGRATAAGTVNVQATVSSAETDVVPSDNTASATTTVVQANPAVGK